MHTKGTALGFPGIKYPVNTNYAGISPSTLFKQGTWLSAHNLTGELMVAATTYTQLNDFNPGPRTPVFTPNNNWSRVWIVFGWDILALKTDLQDNGLIDSEPAGGLLDWPGRGNPYFTNSTGLELPDREMAPFFDVDSDGVYDPWKGDYPVIDIDYSNLTPAMIAWTIYTDHSIHTYSLCPLPLDVEVTDCIFSFGLTGNPVLDETLFLKQEVRNRSNMTLYDLQIGHFLDVQIGCGIDDAYGTAPEHNSVYGYNWLETENLPCPGGYPGYGDYPPVQTCQFLSQSLTASLVLPKNLKIPGKPLYESMRLMMEGHWPDGTALYAQGNGYQTNGQETTFHFHNPPSLIGGWSALSLTEQPENFGLLASSEMPKELQPDEKVAVYSAYSVHRKPGLLPSDQIDYALDRLPQIQSFFDDGFKISGVHPELCTDDCVWPGDLDNNGMVNNLDILTYGVRNGQTDQPRSALFFGWVPLFADNWPNKDSLNANGKHTDANGDGLVTKADADVVSINKYSTRPGFVYWGGSNQPGPELSIERVYNGWTGTDSIIGPGDIFMGRFNFTNPTNDPIYGLGFSIRFDTSIVTWFNGNGALKFMDHPFLTTAFQSVFYRNDGLDIALTNEDGTPVDIDQMAIFELALKIRPDVQIPLDSVTAVKYQNYLLVNQHGQSITIGADNLHIPIAGITALESQKEYEKESLFILPNPGSVECRLNAPFPIQSIRIYDQSGKPLFSLPGYGQNSSIINTSSLISGLYYIEVSSETGKTVQAKWIRE